MFFLYIYNGHWDNDVFMRDSLFDKLSFNSIKEIRNYLTINHMDLDNFDYLIESPNGLFNSIYRYNF